MLLAHLIPFLDAEINRLQQARDLLAQLPLPFTRVATQPLPTPEAEPLSTLLLHQAANEDQQQAPKAVAAAPMPVVPQVLVLKPHRRGAERTSRRRPAPATDTALRGSVPAGPVVISAQAVRQANENKVAHGGKPVAETLPAFDWRPRASDAQDVEAQLLRKLLDIGNSDDTTHAGPSEQLLRFMHS